MARVEDVGMAVAFGGWFARRAVAVVGDTSGSRRTASDESAQ